MHNKKLKVSVSDVEIVNTPDVSVCFATVHIGGEKRRRAFVKTTKKFKESLKTKIIEYSKNRQK